METKKYIESIGQAYKQVQEKKKMDPVDKGELKGKHADRDDKDIDNDGDVDGTDKYLHKRRKAVSKAMDEADYDSKKDHNMDPTSHVSKDKETGKFCVYDINNKKVKIELLL